jgi:DNA-binding NtrC family response regulator
MTRGTVVILGTQDREIEILRDRLIKEGFGVESATTGNHFAKLLLKEVPQVLVVSHNTRPADVHRAIGLLRRKPGTKWTPVMIAAHDEVPAALQRIRGVGEIWRLHEMPLSKIVPRLKLAIQLGQLAKTYNHVRMI